MFHTNDLLDASRRSRRTGARTLQEAHNLGIRTAFLCHSHRDRELAQGLVTTFAEKGCDVYVDWMDASMPEKPDLTTVVRIQQKIVECDLFLFLATQTSMASRWCPWELGYADGKKNYDRILIVPTRTGMTIQGNEYLDIYRRVEVSNTGTVASWRPGESTRGVVLENL